MLLFAVNLSRRDCAKLLGDAWTSWIIKSLHFHHLQSAHFTSPQFGRFWHSFSRFLPSRRERNFLERKCVFPRDPLQAHIHAKFHMKSQLSSHKRMEFEEMKNFFRLFIILGWKKMGNQKGSSCGWFESCVIEALVEALKYIQWKFRELFSLFENNQIYGEMFFYRSFQWIFPQVFCLAFIGSCVDLCRFFRSF